MKNNSCAILALLTMTKHINICDVTIKRFSFAFVFFFFCKWKDKISLLPYQNILQGFYNNSLYLNFFESIFANKDFITKMCCPWPAVKFCRVKFFQQL